MKTLLVEPLNLSNFNYVADIATDSPIPTKRCDAGAVLVDSLLRSGADLATIDPVGFYRYGHGYDTGLVVHNKSKIRSVKELKGKRIRGGAPLKNGSREIIAAPIPHSVLLVRNGLNADTARALKAALVEANGLAEDDPAVMVEPNEAYAKERGERYYSWNLSRAIFQKSSQLMGSYGAVPSVSHYETVAQRLLGDFCIAMKKNGTYHDKRPCLNLKELSSNRGAYLWWGSPWV